MIFKTGTDGEQHIRQRRAGGADEQNRAATVAVGKFAPDGRKNELHRGKRGDDDANHPAAGAVMAAEHWHERHNDAEADEVNEDREKNHEHGRFAIHICHKRKV